MNTFTLIKNNLRFNLALTLALCHCMASCVSTGTANKIKGGQMNKDLEARVLHETGLSGGVLGGVLGGVGGFGLGVLVIALDQAAGGHMSDQQKTALLMGTTVVGAGLGAKYGAQKGQQKGQRLNQAAQQKQKLSELVSGARQYNSKLEQQNDNLRSRIATAKRAKDKKQLAALKQEANSNLKDINSRLGERQKAVGKLGKIDSAASINYARTMPKLQQEKTQLESAIRDIAATESSISL